MYIFPNTASTHLTLHLSSSSSTSKPTASTRQPGPPGSQPDAAADGHVPDEHRAALAPGGDDDARPPRRHREPSGAATRARATAGGEPAAGLVGVLDRAAQRL